jgi:O-succinylbenzoic acid--CoA ligase
VNIVVTYGMTETTGGLVYNGTPLAGAEVKIKDGRICLGGPMLANVEVDADGLFVTNDAGELDESGSLRVLGRIDRVLISGGVKVSLDRVEQLSGLVAGVSEIAATPLADAEWGQRVGICYVGSPEVADDIARALAADLGPSGKPVRVIRVDKLPRLTNGKNDLQAIQNLFKEH